MTDAQSKQDSVGVEQCDRDAAEALLTASWEGDEGSSIDIFAPFFARHRLAAIAEHTRLSTPAEVELRAALKPFANYLYPRDDWGDEIGGPETMAPAGWIRRARAALIGANSDGR